MNAATLLRMKARRCLDPRDASDTVPGELAEAIAMATAEVVAQRANDAGEWIDLVLDCATGPTEPVQPERSPLDARKDDLLGDFNFTDEGFATLTRMVMKIAETHCDAKVVSLLEGGYNVQGLALAVEAHLRAMMEV